VSSSPPVFNRTVAGRDVINFFFRPLPFSIDILSLLEGRGQRDFFACSFSPRTPLIFRLSYIMLVIRVTLLAFFFSSLFASVFLEFINIVYSLKVDGHGLSTLLDRSAVSSLVADSSHEDSRSVASPPLPFSS